MQYPQIDRSFFDKLADSASQTILPHFRQPLAIENKEAPTVTRQAFDPVTIADQSAERVMRALINETYPDHGILGEEFGNEALDADSVWVLDPIDGTRAFISGLPVWGTLIGLKQGGRAAAGMMAQPFTGERFYGDATGAYYTGPGGARPLKTRACASLADATLFTTTPAIFKADERPLYDAVEAAVRLARYGCDCYAYCMVAAGMVDLVVESGLKPFDIVALIPVIEGAGGTVTSWTGGSPLEGGRILASGDARLHDQALTLLSRGA